MLRVVFAVLLTVALLGVAMPAVDTARVERAGTLAEGELDAVESAIRDLISTEEPVPRPDLAARRAVRIQVPTRSITTAPVEFVTIGGLPGRTTPTAATVIAFRVGETTHVRRLPVEVRVLGPDGDLRSAGKPLVLRGTGRVTLLLLAVDGESVVAVTDGDPSAQ